MTLNDAMGDTKNNYVLIVIIKIDANKCYLRFISFTYKLKRFLTHWFCWLVLFKSAEQYYQSTDPSDISEIDIY